MIDNHHRSWEKVSQVTVVRHITMNLLGDKKGAFNFVRRLIFNPLTLLCLSEHHPCSSRIYAFLWVSIYHLSLLVHVVALDDVA